MGKFIDKTGLSRFYYDDSPVAILTVGYDDFHVVKPITSFRTQYFYTWHFVISGSGYLEIYDNTYRIKGGDMFFIPPDTKMRYYPDPNDPWEYVWLSLKGDTAVAYSQQAGFSPRSPVRPIRHVEKTKAVLRRLLDLVMDGDSGYFGVLSAFFEIMEISTARSAVTGIRQVKALLDENFATPAFSVEQFCRDVGISHAHLLRLFKEAYGVTLIQYIRQKRIDLACELLRTTDLSVSSVAYSCGFSDENHFMKTFKKLTGIPALRYRKEAKDFSLFPH